MPSEPIIQQALKQAGITQGIERQRVIAGGASQQVIDLTLSDGSGRVAKVASGPDANRLVAEAEGLSALRATGHLFVVDHEPAVVLDGQACLIMERLEPADSATDQDWGRFAEELAAHHMSPHPERYGWERDNYIGACDQPNTWSTDWVEFNAKHRLGFQLRLAKDGRVNASITDPVERVIDRLDDLIPRHPRPALLHGDLWSGNVLPTTHEGSTRIAVIDPAVYIGDAWADIAMLKLFGGPPKAFHDAYEQRIEDHEQIPQRILVYQLYHMLNHLNLFGGGYASSVSGIAQRLLSM